MSTTSDRFVQVQFTNDVEFSQPFSAQTNATSPGVNVLQALTTGANTVTVPSGSIAVTIIKPAANTVALTLKGVAGDTGIALNLLDPDSISLASVSTFVLNAASAVTVRLIFS
jgi:pyruvate/oxaloacetate carboxyltransferase